jgi:hypothetical protein
VRQFGAFAPDCNLALPFDFIRPVAIRLLVLLQELLKFAGKGLRPIHLAAQQVQNLRQIAAWVTPRVQKGFEKYTREERVRGRETRPCSRPLSTQQ